VAGGHTVYAVDLLGFGASDKPGKSFAFSIDAWAQLVTEFTEQVVGAPVVLVGNSIGSLISLQAAALDADAAGGQEAAAVRGVVLLNCAGGMNSKFILELPDWR
jgi:pimeloyl-ACP methyl ester carboxylesterase